jgi:hypothetical protein
MTGPNRHQRRAAEAKSRLASNKVNYENIVESRILQRMYDDRTAEVFQLQSMFQQQQAITAGVMIEMGADEVTISAETIEMLTRGSIAGFSRKVQNDGSVIVALEFNEGTDEDGIDAGEEE